MATGAEGALIARVSDSDAALTSGVAAIAASHSLLVTVPSSIPNQRLGFGRPWLSICYDRFPFLPELTPALPKQNTQEFLAAKRTMGKYPMEQASIKAVLQAKRNELLAGVVNREDIHVENNADALDNVQALMNREMVSRRLSSDSTLLRRVNSALRRFDAGNFGICLECEEEIPARRLQVLPWADHCVPCQEKADRLKSDTGDETSEAEE
jgi:RNA polymerase-binding transcription factor DksA